MRLKRFICINLTLIFTSFMIIFFNQNDALASTCKISSEVSYHRELKCDLLFNKDNGIVEDADNEALEHRFIFVSMELSDDHLSASVTFQCEHDRNHIEVITAKVEDIIISEPTLTKEGILAHTVTINGVTYSIYESIPKLYDDGTNYRLIVKAAYTVFGIAIATSLIVPLICVHKKKKKHFDDFDLY